MICSTTIAIGTRPMPRQTSTIDRILSLVNKHRATTIRATTVRRSTTHTAEPLLYAEVQRTERRHTPRHWQSSLTYVPAVLRPDAHSPTQHTYAAQQPAVPSTQPPPQPTHYATAAAPPGYQHQDGLVHAAAAGTELSSSRRRVRQLRRSPTGCDDLASRY